MRRQNVGRWARRHRLTGRLLSELRVVQLSRSRTARDLQLCMKAIRSDSTFVDVGASVGNYALAGSHRVGPRGTVLAFEANPVVYRELVASTWGSQVVPLNLAVSDRAGLSTLRVPVDDTGAGHQPLGTLETRFTNTPHEEYEVRSVRLDDLLAPDSDVSAVKIDVEGHELAVLKGAEELLRQSRPTIVLECEARHLTNHEPREVMEWAMERGYEVYGIAAEHLLPWSEFDVVEHQTRWVESREDGTTRISTTSWYINNFILFPVAD